MHALPGTKPYQCEHQGCTQSFSTNQHLRTHTKVHNGEVEIIFFQSLLIKSEKRYTCANSTCIAANGGTIKFYPTWTALQHHNRTEHPPTCLQPPCHGRIFSSQKGLRAHQKIHEQQATEAEIDAAMNTEDADDERPRKKRRGGEVGRDWKCDVDGCTKDFKSARLAYAVVGYLLINLFLQKKALTTHTNITHLGRRDHVCPHDTCKQTFGYKHLLQRHLAKRHIAPSSSDSSDEDPGLPTPATANMDIDTITGNTYAQTAHKKLKAAKALQCPYPHLNGLASVQAGPRCDYVFSRAYDFRRHLQSEHGVVVDKDSVDRWVRWPEHGGFPVESSS